MTTEQYAAHDFDRVYRKAFWRKVLAWLTKERNTLLPFDEVRNRMPIKGQHYLGLKQVEIDKIVGSLGRYQDFDDEFLPIQTHTRKRWINVDRAYYDDKNLPPVELLKMGDMYFVRDGNHRVSVAREWGQEYIDAYVIEIVIPVPITSDMDGNELELQKELATFLDQTQLDQYDPQIGITTQVQGRYAELLEHIAFHRWLLGEQRQMEVSLPEAAVSWYTKVYQPLEDVIQKQEITRLFPRSSVTDIYLWLVKYLWYIRMAYLDHSEEEDLTDEEVEERAVEKLGEEMPKRSVYKLVKTIRDEKWIEQFILQQERYAFFERTHLTEYRPDAHIELTVVGQIDILEKHIAVHRWFLGEQHRQDVPFIQAAVSWYDQVYLPLVYIIRAQRILEHFPGRTETDLYLWILEKQSDIKAVYDIDISVEDAARALTENSNPD